MGQIVKIFKIHKVKNILSKEKWDAIMTEANDFTIRNVGLNILKLPMMPSTRDGCTDYAITLHPVKESYWLAQKLVSVCNKDLSIKQEAEICGGIKYLMQDFYNAIRTDKSTDICTGKSRPYRPILKKFGII